MNDDQEKTHLLQKIAKVTDDYTGVYVIIDALAQAGRFEVLYQVALALEEDTEPLLRSIQQEWAREEHASSLQELTSTKIEQEQLARGAIGAIFGHIEEVLALTPGLPAVESVLKLSEIQREASVQIPLSNLARVAGLRLLASRIASVQEFSVLLDIFERHGDEEQQREFLSCLLQEMVVRGEHLENIPALQRFHHLLQVQKHPLAWLPLMPTSIETDLFLPEHAVGGGYSTPLTYLISNSVPSTSTTGMKETRGIFVETSSATRRERIRTAVLNREEESNGRSEVRMFMTDTLIETITPQVLLSLPLTCLEGTRSTKIVVREIALAQVFMQLFAAAANGGAYNRGHMGAWGRLEAWQSLSGLVAADEQASYRQVLDQALQCQWYSFEAQSAWYYSVAWDLGLVAVSSDRKSLAILAATDTD